MITAQQVVNTRPSSHTRYEGATRRPEVNRQSSDGQICRIMIITVNRWLMITQTVVGTHHSIIMDSCVNPHHTDKTMTSALLIFQTKIIH